MSHIASVETIYPGATLGMIGGGQLGRMFAMAAGAMGYEVIVFCGRHDEPAAQVTYRHVIAPVDDLDAAAEFARQCDVVTLEFENIPVETLQRCAQYAPTRPGARVLSTAQDRGVEKQTLADAGLPVTPFAVVRSADQVRQWAKDQWPIILKTRRSGYDGRGQMRIDDPARLASIDLDHPADGWIAERFIPYDTEISVVVGRNPGGEVVTFPTFQNGHRNHVLDVTTLPADVATSVCTRADEVARSVAETLDLEGLLCVEFFVVGEDLMINEIAPRPHNSGHVTMEACVTDQFEQQVRAVCNLPLGQPDMKVPAAGMLNLLAPGTDSPTQAHWDRWIAPDVATHWYGKRRCKPGRKMGHLTVVGDDAGQVQNRLDQLRW